MTHLIPCTVEIENCPLCGSDKRTKSSHPYYSECDECGLIFMTPRPTPEAYHEFYTSGYYRMTRNASIGQLDRDEMRRAQRVSGLVPRGVSHLDVGCSRGFLLEITRRRGAKQILGVEPYRNWVKVGVPSVATIDEVDGVWECVTCIHTLEHTIDLVGVSRRLADLLAPGGLLVIEVPNVSEMSRGYNQDGHVYYYRPNVIERLFDGLTLTDYSEDPHDTYTFTKSEE